MNHLIRLYPAPWRARYEAELRALLEERPPTGRDVVDLLLGALDARLHPELVERGAANREMPPKGRLGGFLAIAGGSVWLLMCLIVATANPDETNFVPLVWLTLFLMAIGLVGPIPTARARQVRRGVVAGAALLGLGLALPWELKGPPFFALTVLIGAGLLTLAALRAGLSSGRRWLVVGAGFLVPIAIAGAGSMGLIDAGPVDALVQAIVFSAYGIAWVICGALMVRLGGGRRSEPSTPSQATEALAA
jgi:hypothetical protein